MLISVHLWLPIAYHDAMLRTRLLALLLVVSLTGCIGIDRPDAKVMSVRVDEEAAGGARLLVDVAVENPNDEDLLMTRVSYSVDVVGAGQFSFSDVPMAVLPREGVSMLELPAAMRGVGFAGKQYRVQGTVVFAPEGNVRRFLFDAGVPLPRSGFSAEGVLE